MTALAHRFRLGNRRLALPLRGPSLAIALLVAVLVGGTLGYVVIEGWSAWDALYMTITRSEERRVGKECRL